jgi:hypothetical protein
MRIVNLTPHDVVVLDEDGKTRGVIGVSDRVLRLSTVDDGESEETAGVTIRNVRFGVLEWTPERQEDTRYLVSLPVAIAFHRDDFLVPYGEVRDESGRIIGCRELARPVA